MMTTETTFSTNSVRFIQKKKTLALQIQLEVPHLKAQRAVVPGKDSRDLDGSLMSRASTRKALVKQNLFGP